MAHNFNLTGAIYVSKAGNDSNAGTDPNLPKATIGGAIAANLAGVIVVGTGMYNEIISISLASNITGVVGDGNVKIYGSGTSAISIDKAALTVSNISFESYSAVRFSSVNITDCKFKNIASFRESSQNYITGTFLRCIFIDCTFQFSGTLYSNYILTYSIFINCLIRNVRQMTYCYTNSFSTVKIADTATAATFNYNNLMGTISVGNGAYQTLAAHRVSFPALNANSFNLSPRFNGVEKEDFTLQADSPHIIQDSAFIGGTLVGKSTMISSPEFQPENGAIWTGVVRNGNDIVLAPGVTAGTIRSKPIRYSANPARSGVFRYFGLMSFNKSTAGGSTTNINVPDTTVFAGNSPTGMGNPDRLTFELRWTNSDEIPISDSDYINGYLLPAGNFGVFLWNAAPVVDNTGKTNGVQGFNPNAVNAVVFTYFQMQVTLRNDSL